MSAHHVHSKAVVYEDKGLFLPRLYLKMSGHVTRIPAGGTLNLMGNKIVLIISEEQGQLLRVRCDGIKVLQCFSVNKYARTKEFYTSETLQNHDKFSPT